MSSIKQTLNRFSQPTLDISYLRGAMIVIFFFFGYAKWFPYEAEGLFPLLSHSPVLSWMLDAFGKQGASHALGIAEWTICALMILGVWFPRLAVAGACGSIATFATTTTLIFSTPGAWEASAGGFPAMGGATGFLLKDIVLFGASLVLLKAGLNRVQRRE
ncbi:Inner membrane protein YkgB [Caballeronia terrestris]|uniref:Inner membrane protein YkgB n=1 Tax=Caballeronia terrestris TaxID=1226301 RepID=A0A158K6J9_9BURK|nr:DUF417 family protein [Caballeronia terrestris]SAL76615.1 Inner membrane protein YkgB [Caballeronia terrestris]